MSQPWRVESVTGPALALLDQPALCGRAVRFLVSEDRAVVLGSTQPQTDIDPARAHATGVRVLRRRSGGGAVLVGPGLVLWVDVVIPAGDALWANDVGRAFWWLGDVWASALGAAGLDGCRAWRGPLLGSTWSRRICFAGLGPGEVTAGDAKVVGLSQRRTRAGAHFQCAVPIVWDPSELLDVMSLDDPVRNQAAHDLAGAALGIGCDVATRLEAAFVGHLP